MKNSEQNLHVLIVLTPLVVLNKKHLTERKKTARFLSTHS